MRTYKSLCDEVLGLMFSNNTGGNKVSLSDASVKEYMINMHHAFNAGMDDLYSTVVDNFKFIDVNAEANVMYDLKGFFKEKELFIDATNDVFKVDGEKMKKTNAFDYLLRDAIMFNKEGFYKVLVKCKPLKVYEDTEETLEIDIEEPILSALALYMAYRLYFEDDQAAAISYLNQYEAKKADLAEIYKKKDGYYNGLTFESARGWY